MFYPPRCLHATLSDLKTPRDSQTDVFQDSFIENDAMDTLSVINDPSRHPGNLSLFQKGLESVIVDDCLLDSDDARLQTSDAELHHTPSPIICPAAVDDMLETLSDSGDLQMQGPDKCFSSDLQWLLSTDGEMVSTLGVPNISVAVPENIYLVEDEMLLTDEPDVADVVL